MTNIDINQELNALENALAALAEQLETTNIAKNNLESTEILHAEIQRLQANQSQAQEALEEATNLLRNLVSTSTS